ncbi:MAG: energy transducer TonB [Bacteroidales bacterium]|nr:energy transducer TonB [Bacteroidales bacterium]MDT8431013.1 energy transducer TonB [Bacteroidales bacterium]
MRKQHKHSNNKVSDFFDYVSGKLSGKDRNAFERRLQKDPFEAEAAEGFAKVSRDEAEQDLERIAGRIRNRIRRKRRIVWYSAAAAIASMMIVATVFFNVDDGSMDRYKTAPEFEEAVQEQPSATGMEKEHVKKDVIPDAEELAKKDVIQEAEQRVLAEKDVIQDAEELARKNMITGEQEVQEALRQDEDQVYAENQLDKENQLNVEEYLKKENLVQDELMIQDKDQVRQEELRQNETVMQVLSYEQRAAVAKDAAECSKRAAPATPYEPADREFQQDEIPQSDELQPMQMQVQKEKALQPVHEQVREASTSPSLQGQVAGVEVTEEIPIDASQPKEIAMVPDAVQLEEVVVVGNEITKKTALTGAVSKVEPDPVTETEYITASPADGIVAYRQYIDTTLVYPADAVSSEKEVVVLKFSITPGGRPYNYRVVRSPGASFTQEAMRVVTDGPDWRPATRDGMYVDDEVRLRIVFRTDQ